MNDRNGTFEDEIAKHGQLVYTNVGDSMMPDRKYRLYVHLWCDFFFIRAVILWIKALPGRLKRKL